MLQLHQHITPSSVGYEFLMASSRTCMLGCMGMNEIMTVSLLVLRNTNSWDKHK